MGLLSHLCVMMAIGTLGVGTSGASGASSAKAENEKEEKGEPFSGTGEKLGRKRQGSPANARRRSERLENEEAQKNKRKLAESVAADISLHQAGRFKPFNAKIALKKEMDADKTKTVKLDNTGIDPKEFKRFIETHAWKSRTRSIKVGITEDHSGGVSGTVPEKNRRNILHHVSITEKGKEERIYEIDCFPADFDMELFKEENFEDLIDFLDDKNKEFGTSTVTKQQEAIDMSEEEQEEDDVGPLMYHDNKRLAKREAEAKERMQSEEQKQAWVILDVLGLTDCFLTADEIKAGKKAQKSGNGNGKSFEKMRVECRDKILEKFTDGEEGQKKAEVDAYMALELLQESGFFELSTDDNDANVLTRGCPGFDTVRETSCGNMITYTSNNTRYKHTHSKCQGCAETNPPDMDRNSFCKRTYCNECMQTVFVIGHVTDMMFLSMTWLTGRTQEEHRPKTIREFWTAGHVFVNASRSIFLKQVSRLYLVGGIFPISKNTDFDTPFYQANVRKDEYIFVAYKVPGQNEGLQSKKSFERPFDETYHVGKVIVEWDTGFQEIRFESDTGCVMEQVLGAKSCKFCQDKNAAHPGEGGEEDEQFHELNTFLMNEYYKTCNEPFGGEYETWVDLFRELPRTVAAGKAFHWMDQKRDVLAVNETRLTSRDAKVPIRAEVMEDDQDTGDEHDDSDTDIDEETMAALEVIEKDFEDKANNESDESEEDELDQENEMVDENADILDGAMDKA